LADPSATVTVFERDLPAEVADAFVAAGRVACDTETTGLDWRRDRLAICQFYEPSVGLAIVRIDGDGANQVVRLLEDDSLVKVFHHAPFDLRFLCSSLRARPRSIQCTKVASKLLRPGVPNAQHSLASLLSEFLQVQITKGAVRTSDWTSDLDAEQLTYAGNDVRYLLPLLEAVVRQLRDCGRLEVFERCCQFLPVRVETELLGVDDVFAY
jgi:ribonuclease D